MNRKMRRRSNKFRKMYSYRSERDVKFDPVLPQCFICDSLVVGKGVPLLLSTAPYSKIALPTKISQLMGDGFMVIVTGKDVLCRRCASLIIRLDKLEIDMEVVRKALTGYLKMKYNLHVEDDESKRQTFNNSKTFDMIDEAPCETECNDQLIYQALKGIDLICSEDESNNTAAVCKQQTGDEVEVKNFEDVDVTGYKCVSCQFKTTSSNIFMEHLKMHSNEMYFKCSNCDKEFHSHLDIQEHITNVHYSQTQLQETAISDKSPKSLTFYECNVCKFQSADKTVFDVHVLKHRKVYKCSVCFKKLKSKTLLKEHLKSHKAYNFKCGLCKLTFNEKNKLLEHFVQHRLSKVLQVKEDQSIMEDSKDETKEEIWLAQVDAKDEDTNFIPKKEKTCDKVEALHSENPSSDIKDTDLSIVNESEKHNNTSEDVEIPMDSENHDESTVKKSESETIFKDNDVEEVSFLLENTVFEKDDDDPVTADIDRNEGSETNDDYLTDPSSYLHSQLIEFQSDTGKQDMSQIISESIVVKEDHSIDVKQSLENSLPDDDNDVTKNVTATPVKKRVYVCSICGLRAYTESHMKRHFKSHVAVEKKIFECHICNKVLTTRSNLNRHLSNHENCSGVVTCKLCNEELTDRLHLKQHLEDQHTGPQLCSFCNMEFTSKRAFKEHELTHPENALHQCELCHKRFLTELRLKVHLENIHNNAKDGETDDKIYKCHICSKILTTYHNLKRHVRNHEKSSGSAKCTLCSEELTDKLHLRQHVEEMHPETHQCPFCQKVFSNKKVCKAHELNHPERYVYKCDICEKMFLNETRLEKHKRMFHRDPHCRYCEKEIKDPVKLFNHEHRHEMYKNKFPCELCPKVFRTPSGLKYHMSVHTGKYAVYCEICGKGMHSEIVLEEHKATHTKEIRYTCELCGRNFSSNSTYRMHRKWHDDPLPYKCKICDRKFKHTSILAVHMRRAHTGERPYKCPHCPYTFSVSSTLQKHIILHTKKYPHNCKLCGKGFTTRTKIARHMARLHNDFEMLNAKPTPCQYKMVLKPSEMSTAEHEDSSIKLEQQLPSSKFEVVEEQIVESSQTIFLFQGSV